MEQNAHGRRPHHHRGRRGPDRRGPDRRAAQNASPEQGNRDQIDVEQIMREIRTRISQRHGIELSNQQIQELAARRLEAILDPRTLNPRLLEQLRRGAAAAPDVPAAEPVASFKFEDATLYESHRGFLRFMRRLLNPILKLFFNPNPLISALNTQARLNKAMATREAEAARRQTEWNALHYELLQRVVTEISRVSLEMQSLALRVESLSTKVDFNDRRVRLLENSASAPRASQRPVEQAPAAVPQAAPADAVSAEGASPAEAAGDGSRRRRRRRRGRRTGGPGQENAASPADQGSGDVDAGDDGDEAVEEDPENLVAQADAVAAFTPAADAAAVPVTAPPPAAGAPPPVPPPSDAGTSTPQPAPSSASEPSDGPSDR